MTETQNAPPKEFEQLLLCAHWIVGQFEDMHLYSIAKIFQLAVEDAESWVHTMAANDGLMQEYDDVIKLTEAQAIRGLLVKYANIQDPEKRKEVLEKMNSVTQTIEHAR